MTDRTSGAPKAGVRMVLSNAEGTILAVTAPDGRYVIEVKGLEEITAADLRAEIIGSIPSNRPVSLVPGTDQTQDFQLTSQP